MYNPYVTVYSIEIKNLYCIPYRNKESLYYYTFYKDKESTSVYSCTTILFTLEKFDVCGSMTKQESIGIGLWVIFIGL